MKLIQTMVLSLLLSWGSFGQPVDQFGMFKARFEARGQYDNPYQELEAAAKIKLPNGATRTMPLFWDGGNTWKLRISPDLTGRWSFVVRSSDSGLGGQKGAFECVASKLGGSIEPMKEYPHHFQRQNGEPFLFWGDTAWALYLDDKEEQHDRSAVFHYMDERAGQGVNVIHSMLLSEAGWGNQGGAPFENLSKEKLNPFYWREIDIRLRYLNEKGIVGGLVLAWGDKRKKEPYAWRRFPSVQARKRYARYIAARYGAFHVYFIVSGEWHAEIRSRGNTTEDKVRHEFIEIGNALASADAHGRMIGIHPMSAHGSVREFHRAGWMSFGDYQQNYADLHERMLASRKVGKPIVNSEYGYFLRDSSFDGKVDKHNSFSAADMRFATWDIVMAGGYPVTGYGTTYMGGHRDPGPFNVNDPRNDIWERHYQIIQSFLASLDWWKLQPRDEWISSEIPRGSDRVVTVRMGPGQTRKVRRPPLVFYGLLAEPGRHYIIYMRGLKKPIDLKLDSNARGRYSANLLDPRTGEEKTIADKIEVSASFSFTPPDTRDWVLHLMKRSD